MMKILLCWHYKIKRMEKTMRKGSIVTRLKCALVIIVFMLIPIIPITGAIGLFILIFRPIWFKKLIDRVYVNKKMVNEEAGID